MLTSELIFLCVIASLLCYINGAFPYPVHYNFPHEVDEFTERQYTVSKEQAHVATKLTKEALCLISRDILPNFVGQMLISNNTVNSL